MKSILTLFIFLIFIILGCKKNDPTTPSNHQDAELFFNEGEILIDDTTIYLKQSPRFVRYSDTSNVNTDGIILIFDDRLVFRIHTEKDSSNYTGEYTFSSDTAHGTISFADVFSGKWFDSNSPVFHADHRMLHGKIFIDTTSSRFDEDPTSGFRSDYYQYYQEVNVSFYGLLKENGYTLNYGNENIDTVLFSGYFRGFIHYHDREKYNQF